MPMRSARRLASVAAVASLAVAGLSACRSEPSVAAYLGDSKITESRVTDVFDEMRDAVEAAGPPAQGQPAAPPITRAEVARVLVSAEVLPVVAQQQGVTPPADLQLKSYAQALQVPESTEFIRLFAQEDNYATALRQKAKGAPTPTEAQLHDVFDALVAAGQQGTYEDFKAKFPAESVQVVASAYAVQGQIEQVTDKMHVTVNPRYAPLGIPVLQIQGQTGEILPVVEAPMGGDQSVPVTDVR